MPYDTTAQAPYPTPTESLTDDLSVTAKATAREIVCAPSLLSFLSSKQQKTLGSLIEGIRQPAVTLIQNYAEEGIPAHTGPNWSPQALETASSDGPHASSCTLDMTTFIPGEMQRRIKYGFRILLPETYELRLFGEKLKLSHILAFPQAHCHLCLILNLSEKPDVGMPSLDDATNREAAPESLQFGMDFPCIL